MLKITIFFLIIITQIHAQEFIYKRGPQKVGKGNSGIYGPSYEEIVSSLKNLAKSNPRYAKAIKYGQTEQGIGLYGLIIRDHFIASRTLVTITGATHGNEYLAIADNLMGKFLDKNNSEFYQYFDRGGAVFLVPIVNPYGYINNTRENGNYRDLNRDFSNIIEGQNFFLENETRFLSSWVDEFINRHNVDFKIAIDYHCCYRGALLFPWGYTDTPLPTVDRQEYNIIGELMVRHFDSAQYGETSEILWYSANGTSLDYWHSKYGANSMTYEGRYRTEKNNLLKHVAWWKDIIKNL